MYSIQAAHSHLNICIYYPRSFRENETLFTRNIIFDLPFFHRTVSLYFFLDGTIYSDVLSPIFSASIVLLVLLLTTVASASSDERVLLAVSSFTLNFIPTLLVTTFP